MITNGDKQLYDDVMSNHSGADPECLGCFVKRIVLVLNDALFSAVSKANGCREICAEAGKHVTDKPCKCQEEMLAHLVVANKDGDEATN